jgi:hypothetical protein
MPKKYSHLLKPLVVKDGPAGLYPEPRIWGGGKEWEDFRGHFSYGFLRTTGVVCHPVEEAVVHPYDEVLVCAGTNFSNILDLGGEMSIEIGEEREEHIFNRSQVICIPRGTPHGALKVRKMGDKPIAHYLWGLAPEYKAVKIPGKSRPAKTKGSKHAQLIKLLRTYVPDEKRASTSHVLEDTRGRSKTGMGYESMMDKRGVMHPRDKMGPGNADQLVWLFGEDIQNFKLNFTWGFWSAAGKWHRPGEGHLHPEEEALIFVGLDPDRPDYVIDLKRLIVVVQFELRFTDQTSGTAWPPKQASAHYHLVPDKDNELKIKKIQYWTESSPPDIMAPMYKLWNEYKDKALVELATNYIKTHH